MPSNKYMEVYHGYWPAASQKIYELLTEHVSKRDSICEVGAASGHLMANLSVEGYHVAGYEIREREYSNTSLRFKESGISAQLYHGSILDATGSYDAIYSTGLLQCLNGTERTNMIKKLSELSDKVIIIVPEILEERNCCSEEITGVSGCHEFKTTLLPYELSAFFNYIRGGLWNAHDLQLDDNFLYYICENVQFEG